MLYVCSIPVPEALPCDGQAEGAVPPTFRPPPSLTLRCASAEGMAACTAQAVVTHPLPACVGSLLVVLHCLSLLPHHFCFFCQSSFLSLLLSLLPTLLFSLLLFLLPSLLFSLFFCLFFPLFFSLFFCFFFPVFFSLSSSVSSSLSSSVSSSLSSSVSSSQSSFLLFVNCFSCFLSFSPPRLHCLFCQLLLLLILYDCLLNAVMTSCAVDTVCLCV